jgi:hypothetical protein
VGSRNLDGGLVTIIGRSEIYQRRAAEADIVHVCTGVRDTLEKIVVDFLAGETAVASYKDFVCAKKLWQEITHLVCNFLVKIYIVDTSDVICVKCSHSI